MNIKIVWKRTSPTSFTLYTAKANVPLATVFQAKDKWKSSSAWFRNGTFKTQADARSYCETQFGATNA